MQPAPTTTLAPAAPAPAGKRRVLDWTVDQVDLLTQRWAAGATAAQIAAELGDPAWRNAVIGKATRLGLERRNANAGRPRGGAKALETARTVSVAVPAPSVPSSPRKPARAAAAVAAAPREPVAIDLPRPAPGRDHVAGGVAIHDLEHQHYRWPLNEVARGEGERLLYCGAPRGEGDDGKLEPYCAAHAAMAYAPRRTERQQQGDAQRRETHLRRLGRAA